MIAVFIDRLKLRIECLEQLIKRRLSWQPGAIEVGSIL